MHFLEALPHVKCFLIWQERRREVLAALRAAGFQMYGEGGSPLGNPETYLADGLKVGELSGGQRHLIYILSVLAAQVRGARRHAGWDGSSPEGGCEDCRS